MSSSGRDLYRSGPFIQPPLRKNIDLEKPPGYRMTVAHGLT